MEPRAARHTAIDADGANRAPAMDTAGEGHAEAGLAHRSKRGSKYRRGGFLLQDAVASGPGEGEEAPGSRRKHSRLLHSIRPKGSSKKDKKTSTAGHSGLGVSQPDSEPRSPTSSAEHPAPESETPTDEPASQGEQPEHPPLDVESAQIVDMALRISQSRRAASQRVVSQHTPPRLAPLPDTTGVSSLRQHLLQQRKVSRTGSPRPRNASTMRHALDSFDVTAQDGSYRYHISRSTLGRVQRAKEYMELMAQYRRLLGHLPPLRAGPPPGASLQMDEDGRQYNPLQYIRNRKVRARERQPLDGEAQGFKDVTQVANWVDEVVDWSNADNHDEAQPLPTFATAEHQRNEVPSASEGSKAAAKLARRRIDWLVEPADLIADAYWLEQGSNKSLIQDRHWDRLYPRVSDASLRPSPQVEERQSGQSRPVTKDQNEETTKADEELSHTSPRARLLTVRGIHRRHSSSGHNHDFLRRRRSASDISDNDGDFKEIARTGTMTTSGKDILEKQMMEMIAREEREGVRSSRSDASPPQPSDKTEAQSSLPSRIHSRNGSLVDISESEEKGSLEKPPDRRPTRLRVDVPRPRRSLDVESAPNSPEHPPSRDSYAGFSPVQSRPASPSRNPFSKVKQYFGDRNRAAYIDDRIHEIDDADPHRPSVENAPSGQERRGSPERRVSGSPTRKGSRKTSMEGRAHLRVPSIKTKGEEQMGVRGILKAPARIDNVLRTGVSKIGDIIWRKDSDDTGGASEGTMTDESEERSGRGRAGSRAEDPRRSYLEHMPAFTPERKPPSASAKSSRRPSIQSGFSDSRRHAPAPPPVPESEPEREASPPRPVLPPSLGTRHFSMSARTNASREREHGPISRREIARLRALLLSSGVMAMEISRRAGAKRRVGGGKEGVPWGELAPLGEVPQTASPLESYPIAARLLEDSIATSSHTWQEKATAFASETAPALHSRLDALRIKLAVDLSSTIRGASDEADEVGREATQTQRLRVKRVVDVIEKMLRRRRRRFRWVRRGMWLGVEWVLVGCMWYVWFVVMVVRVLAGVGRGAVGGVRWLLWM